jgi:hypothetical protein
MLMVSALVSDNMLVASASGLLSGQIINYVGSVGDGK